MNTIDVDDLRDKVKAMYRAVAEAAQGEFHFEMGHDLAARLGYPTDELAQIPAEALESFAGVGHHLGLAALQEDESSISAAGPAPTCSSPPAGSARPDRPSAST